MQALDLRGKKFGRWTALEVVGRSNNQLLWKCRCDCGRTVEVVSGSLVSGKSVSCGCLRTEKTIKRRRDAREKREQDNKGKVFGELTLIGWDEQRRRWKCRCKCGRSVYRRWDRVREGVLCIKCGIGLKRRGENHPLFKGGHINGQGYKVVPVGDGTRRLEHRYLVEKAIGRKLDRRETVHHLNGVRSDNRLDNFEVRSGHHGAGQRVVDLIAWAQSINDRYGTTFPDLIAQGLPASSQMIFA